MIVIGDVHGCFNTLQKLLEQLPNGKELCFLGDLIDRGPDSKKVVQFVKDGGHFCVLGNHEDLALSAHDDPLTTYNWLANGGTTALESYGGEIGPDHLTWFRTLPLTLAQGNFIMSHSNVAGQFGLVDDKNYILWNRELDIFLTDGRVNVFGHTPTESPVVGPGHVRIDTGCVFGKTLTAYDTDTGHFFQQPNAEA